MSTAPTNPVSPSTLPRTIGLWVASAVVVGTVIGSGVFKKGRNVAENVPEFGLAISVWVLGGLLALMGALTLAETAVRYPRAGGNYVFLREGYGRWAGFLWGWVDFGIIRSASIAVLAVMFVESLHDILKQSLSATGSDVMSFWPRQIAACLVIAGLSYINIRGTKIGGGVQLVLTLVKVFSLIALILLPFVVLFAGNATGIMPTTRNFQPLWPSDWSQVNWSRYGAAVVAVLWAYHGWMNIGPIAEEVKQPQRNIPLALLGGVLALIALYVGANIAYYTAVPREEMQALTNTTVATEYCLRLIGPLGLVIASLIVMMSVLGSLNGNILVAPRLLYAMGEDRLAPASLHAIHAKYKTPAIATVVFACWSIILVLSLGAMTVYRLPTVSLMGLSLDVNFPPGKVPFDVLTDYAMFGAVTFETMAVAAIFVFRYRQPEVTRALPYRCLGYPIVPLLYVVIMTAVLWNMFGNPEQRSEAVIGVGFVAIGTAVYFLIVRRFAK